MKGATQGTMPPQNNSGASYENQQMATKGMNMLVCLLAKQTVLVSPFFVLSQVLPKLCDCK
jgi:hypothetical protein